MKKLITRMIAKMIMGTPLEPLTRKLISKLNITFTSSAAYWEKRYSSKGTSGAGSYGKLAAFKASVINQFVEEHQINSVVEFGCGDGHQLSLATYPTYVGLDISPTAVQLCKEKYKEDSTKVFATVSEGKEVRAELSLSLDVIYHLVEDDIYHEYMTLLFNASTLFVCVYSSNFIDESVLVSKHVRHREFTTWVQENAPEFQLISEIKNIYPYDVDDHRNTSRADFFFFKRVGA